MNIETIAKKARALHLQLMGIKNPVAWEEIYQESKEAWIKTVIFIYNTNGNSDSPPPIDNKFVTDGCEQFLDKRREDIEDAWLVGNWVSPNPKPSAMARAYANRIIGGESGKDE